MNQRARSGWDSGAKGEPCGGLACKSVHPCPPLTGQSGRLVIQGSGRTVISFGDAVSGSVRRCRADEQSRQRRGRCQLVFTSVGVGFRFSDNGVRLWFGLRVGARPTLFFLLAQKNIVRGFRVLAGSRPMIPGQREHGAVVTPAGFRELGRGKDGPPKADLRPAGVGSTTLGSLGTVFCCLVTDRPLCDPNRFDTSPC